MYKIKKSTSDDPFVLPVATVPTVLRQHFQFFTRNEKLRYFNYVDRHRQDGKTMPRVAIVVQSKLVIADLTGHVKRCINIRDIARIKVQVAHNTSKVLLTIPSEYDLLVDVIRSGQLFLKALTLTQKMLGGPVNLETGTLGPECWSHLKCPSGHKKKTSFQLMDASGSRSGSSETEFEKLTSPTVDPAVTDRRPSKVVVLSDSSESTLTSSMCSTSTSPAAAAAALDESAAACDDAQKPASPSSPRRGPTLESVLAAVSREARCEVTGGTPTEAELSPSSDMEYSGDLLSGSFDCRGKSKWVVGDIAEIFHLQDGEFMGWSPCTVVNYSDEGVTVRLHVTSYNSSPDIITSRIAVKGFQLRRISSADSFSCLAGCWCR
eukprot:TRINITY_DN7600_c1_g1_i1.p1 TRINITY_DN7600_c1_g1~~TRINITY_DN7600_c1_g1_i1.p1  ORF type:complete len:392 (+),score=64.52 TRINITY_DN7600_c1_g1_i1:44-1177(+)